MSEELRKIRSLFHEHPKLILSYQPKNIIILWYSYQISIIIDEVLLARIFLTGSRTCYNPRIVIPD